MPLTHYLTIWKYLVNGSYTPPPFPSNYKFLQLALAQHMHMPLKSMPMPLQTMPWHLINHWTPTHDPPLAITCNSLNSHIAIKTSKKSQFNEIYKKKTYPLALQICWHQLDGPPQPLNHTYNRTRRWRPFPQQTPSLGPTQTTKVYNSKVAITTPLHCHPLTINTSFDKWPLEHPSQILPFHTLPLTQY